MIDADAPPFDAAERVLEISTASLESRVKVVQMAWDSGHVYKNLWLMRFASGMCEIQVLHNCSQSWFWDWRNMMSGKEYNVYIYIYIFFFWTIGLSVLLNQVPTSNPNTYILSRLRWLGTIIGPQILWIGINRSWNVMMSSSRYEPWFSVELQLKSSIKDNDSVSTC